jgi:hypothetical protein
MFLGCNFSAIFFCCHFEKKPAVEAKETARGVPTVMACPQRRRRGRIYSYSMKL